MKLLTILFTLLFPLVSAPGSETALPRVRWEREQRLTADPAPSLLTYNFARSIAADGSGRVHAVWYDARDGSPRIYYKRSADSGKSWDPDTRLSETAGPDEHPAIAISGRIVYVVWHGIRDGRFDIFLRRSADGGLTWEPTTALTDGHKAAHASIAASGFAVRACRLGRQPNRPRRDPYAALHGLRPELGCGNTADGPALRVLGSDGRRFGAACPRGLGGLSRRKRGGVRQALH